MKICFLLQRNFAYVGHAMASALKERHGVTEFCGIVQMRSSYEFLRSQKEIAYTNLVLDDEVVQRYKNEPLDAAYLSFLEKEYGIPNLWPYIEIDRVLRHGLFLRDYPYDASPYTHDELMRVLQVKAKAIINFLEQERPDAVVFSVIGDATSLLLYHIAKKKGIQVCFVETARIGNQFTVTEDYRVLSEVEKIFNLLQQGGTPSPTARKKAEVFLREFRKEPKPHSAIDSIDAKPLTRKKQFAFLSPLNLFRSVHWTVRSLINYLTAKNRGDYETSLQRPHHHLWDTLQRKLRIARGFDDLYDEVNTNEDFAFFPLHLEPEMSIWLFAPFYTDQLWLIKQVARSLPWNFKLYVKEHPAMYGFRPRQFYQELKKIPGVKLVRPTESGLSLVRHAKLITAITSTAGWEGVLLQKPVISFGEVFYNRLASVKKCTAIEALPSLVQSQLHSFRHDDAELLNMITAIFQESADCDFVQIWDRDGTENMERKKTEVIGIVDYLANVLRIRSNSLPSTR